MTALWAFPEIKANIIAGMNLVIPILHLWAFLVPSLMPNKYKTSEGLLVYVVTELELNVFAWITHKNIKTHRNTIPGSTNFKCVIRFLPVNCKVSEVTMKVWIRLRKLYKD